MGQDWLTTKNVQTLTLLALTVIGLYLCYLFALPFLPALALALALANLFLPIHILIKKEIRNSSLAAALSLTLVGVAIVVPVIFVGEQIVPQIQQGTQTLQREIEAGTWRISLEQNSRLSSILNWLEREVNFRESALRLAEQIPAFASSFLISSGEAIAQLFLAFFILYFFFRDRDQFLKGLRSLLPLTESETNNIIKSVNDTLHASINSLLIIAAVQGTLGGLMFWILGLPSPVLWGVVMSFFALLPFVGMWMIWIPGAILLALNGNYFKALILLGWGATALSFIDNLLYPKLVGDRLRFHSLLIFFAFLGGVSVFGSAGIVLGPVVLAITSALLEIWNKRAAIENENNIANLT